MTATRPLTTGALLCIAVLGLALAIQLVRSFGLASGPWRRGRALASAVDPLELQVAETVVPARVAGDPDELEERLDELRQRMAVVASARDAFLVEPEPCAPCDARFLERFTEWCHASGLQVQHMQRGPLRAAVPRAPGAGLGCAIRLRGDYAGLRRLGECIAAAPSVPYLFRFAVRVDAAAHPIGALRIELEFSDCVPPKATRADRRAQPVEFPVVE